MNGWVFTIGLCIGCGKTFGFNPHLVPSTRIVTGEREPLCHACFDRINQNRAGQGLAPLVLQPGAYDPLPEEEL